MSTSDDSTLVDRPLLDATNYSEWKISMKFLLCGKGAWKIVNGTEEEPVGTCEEAIRDIQYWNERANKAAALIWAYCTPQARSYLRNQTSPRVMWLTLEMKMDNTRTVQGRRALWKKFYESTPPPNLPITAWIWELLNIQTDLVGTKQEIQDEDIINLVICRIPDSYGITKHELSKTEDTTVVTLMNTLSEHEMLYQTTIPTASGVAHQPTAKWCRHCKCPSHDTKDCYEGKNDNNKRGAPSGSNNKRHAKSARTNRDVECHYCTKKGHIATECKLKKAAAAFRARYKLRS